MTVEELKQLHELLIDFYNAYNMYPKKINLILSAISTKIEVYTPPCEHHKVYLGVAYPIKMPFCPKCGGEL